MSPLPEELNTRKISPFGARPSLPDPRDKWRDDPLKLEVPGHVDLCDTGFMPPVWDQSELGSCQPHASGACFAYEAARQGLPPIDPSRLFLYFNARALEGATDSDSGSTVADGMKALAQLGAAPTSDWPYDISQFAVRPPDQAYTDAAVRLALEYRRVNPSLHSKKCCVALGTPIAFGFVVFSSFVQPWPTPGLMPVPNPAAESVEGAHAVVIVGYDDAARCFKVRNSWGPEWGLGGYFWMPYEVALDQSLSWDFWTLESVEEPGPATPVSAQAPAAVEEHLAATLGDWGEPPIAPVGKGEEFREVAPSPEEQPGGEPVEEPAPVPEEAPAPEPEAPLEPTPEQTPGDPAAVPPPPPAPVPA